MPAMTKPFGMDLPDQYIQPALGRARPAGMDMAKTACFRVYAEVDGCPPLIGNWRIAENRKDNPSKTIGGRTERKKGPGQEVMLLPV